MISRDVEFTVRTVAEIPDKGREHAIKAIERIWSKFCERFQQDFGVASGVEPATLSFQLLTQLREVVDLAVENQSNPTILGLHRLLATDDVDNRQPPMHGGEATAAMSSMAVRTAVLEPIVEMV